MSLIEENAVLHTRESKQRAWAKYIEPIKEQVVKTIEILKAVESVNPAIKKMDDTKRQCWLDNGIYRYNELGSDWILTQLGASTIAYDDIIQLYHTAPGEENAEIMKNM